MSNQPKLAAGDLDPEFGEDGIVSLAGADPRGSYVYLKSVIAIGDDANAKIHFCAENGHPVAGTQFLIGRLDLGGAPDTTFGNNGVVQLPFPGHPYISVAALAIQTDGKLIASAIDATASNSTFFVRLHPDGRVDSSFGESGFTVVRHPFASRAPKPKRQKKEKPRTGIDQNSQGRATLEILPDGKILSVSSEGYLVRLTNDGRPDTTFNQVGYLPIIHPNYPAARHTPGGLLVQDNRHYLVSGSIATVPTRAFFMRCDNEGNLDTSFGPSGNGFIFVEEEGDDGMFFNGLASQPNRRFLGVGATANYGDEAGLLVSREADGEINIQFNQGKSLFTKLEAKKRTLWMGAAIQGDGRVVVAGALGDPIADYYELVVARFNNNATFDTSFGNGQGWVRTALPGNIGGYATTMTLQLDGKILVAATVSDTDSAAILRFLSSSIAKAPICE